MQKYCLCNYFCNVNSCFALCGLSIPGKLLWWGPLSRGDLAARSTPLSQDPLAIQLLKPHISPHRQVCRQEKLRSGRDTSQPASPISFFQGFRADPTGKKKNVIATMTVQGLLCIQTFPTAETQLWSCELSPTAQHCWPQMPAPRAAQGTL